MLQDCCVILETPAGKVGIGHLWVSMVKGCVLRRFASYASSHADACGQVRTRNEASQLEVESAVFRQIRSIVSM